MPETAEARMAGRFARPSRVLVVGLALLAASIGVARLTFWVVKRSTSAAIWDLESGNKNRVVDATARLESVASEPGPKVLFLGTSIIAVGVSPPLFDAELASAYGRKVTSYNFGLHFGNVSLTRVFARATQLAFERAHSKADVVVLDLIPSLMTERYRNRKKTILTLVQRKAIISSQYPAVLPEMMLESPGETLKVIGTMALGNETPEVLITALKRKLDPGSYNTWPVTLFALKLDERGRLGWGWDPDVRGQEHLFFPEDAELTAAYMKWVTVPNWDRDTRRLEFTHDVKELRFEHEGVEQFIGLIRQVRKFSNHVFVFVGPVAPPARPTESGFARYQALVRRIEIETGVEIIDFSSAPQFELSDFRDGIHLNEHTGSGKLTRLLAHRIGEQLDKGKIPTDGQAEARAPHP